MNRKFIIFIGIVAILSCTKPPNYPIEPVIKFVSWNKTTILQGDSKQDSLKLILTFTDGDGDLGSSQTNISRINMFVIDKRKNQVADSLSIPFVPLEGAGNGISGKLEASLFTTCCYFKDATPPCSPSTTYPLDTVTYEIYIKDRAGHVSNKIITDPVVVQCK